MASLSTCHLELVVWDAGFSLSVVIAGTMNPKARTTYHAQPVAKSLHITDHCGYTGNIYIYIYNVIVLAF